jgi:hypothetical protein
MRTNVAEETGVPPAKVVEETATADKTDVMVTTNGQKEPASSVPATVAGTDLAVYDFGDDVGAGTENMRLEEQLVPFLSILQGLSPQLNRAKPEYLDEARMGNILNTATGALYDGAEGVEAMPVWRDYQFTEWLPRDDVVLPDGKVIRGGGGDGQGFRGIHAPDSPEVRKAVAEAVKKYGPGARFRSIPFFNMDKEEDTILIEQFNLGVMYGGPALDESTVRRAMLAFTSTKISVYKQWLAAATDIKYPNPRAAEPNQPRVISPPLWAHRWRLTTVPQSNRKGDFFNWRLSLAEKGAPQLSLVRRTDPLYVMAKEFHDQWAAGQVKADYDADEKGGAGVEQDIPL